MGVYIDTVLDSVSGRDASLQSLESSFAQDLNGDGFIGAVPPMLIEGSGSTKLDQIGNNYFLDAVTGPGGSGPVLQLGSVRFDTSYQGFVPVGAERQSDGTYFVALKVPGDDRYIVWKADSSGNYLATVRDPVSGSDPILKSLEASFGQDLNGDGVITNPLIESFGSTKLDQIGNHFYLDRLAGAGGSGPLFQLGSVFDTSYQGFVPVGAELQSDGNYLVALKVPDDDKYIVWKADSTGNYFATVLDPVSGNDASLQSLETSFHQDLNGDGAIGTPPTVAVEFLWLNQARPLRKLLLP